MIRPSKKVSAFLGAILLISGGIYIFNTAKNYIKDQKAQTVVAQEQIETSKKMTADLQAKIDKLENPLQSQEFIANFWSNKVVKVSCDFYATNGKYIQTNQGSGTLFIDNNKVSVLTNRHVLSILNGTTFYHPFLCGVSNSFEDSPFISYYSQGDIAINRTDDWGIITINNPDNLFKDSADIPLNICKPFNVGTGSKILILGYPEIGSKYSVTVTDGIISAYDGYYYITSAKIDHGNSGGAAIDLENDCFIGIPTMVIGGSLESLGRILDANLVF